MSFFIESSSGWYYQGKTPDGQHLWTPYRTKAKPYLTELNATSAIRDDCMGPEPMRVVDFRSATTVNDERALAPLAPSRKEVVLILEDARAPGRYVRESNERASQRILATIWTNDKERARHFKDLDAARDYVNETRIVNEAVVVIEIPEES